MSKDNSGSVPPQVPIEERAKLQELTYLYAMYVDTKQTDKVVELFTDDAIMNEDGIGYPSAQGRENLRSIFADGATQVGSMIHYVTNHIITEYAETSAAGQCFVFAEARTLKGDPVRVFGYYDDKYVKIDGQWRFKSRHVKAVIPPELALK